MKVNDPLFISNPVRADSDEAKNGFRYIDEDDNTYNYFVPMDSNSVHLYIRRSMGKDRSIFIAPSHILVFNVQSNSAGIVKADRMVEPVDFTVNAERKE